MIIERPKSGCCVLLQRCGTLAALQLKHLHRAEVCGTTSGGSEEGAVLLCRVLALCLCCQPKRLLVCCIISVDPEEVAHCLCSSLMRLQCAAGLCHAICQDAGNALQGCGIISVGPNT